MSTLEQILFSKKTDHDWIDRRSYLWNLIASLVFSVQSALLLLAATRFSGLEAAGMFSIYYVTTQMMSSLGSYSIANFQVSDARQEYTLGTYYSTRIVTGTLMILADILYTVVTKRPFEGIVIMMLLTAYRTIEVFESYYNSQIQKEGRLDAVSVGKTLRIGISTGAFMLFSAISHSIIAATLVMLLIALLIYFCNRACLLRVFPGVRPTLTGEKISALLIACFPLAVGAVLYSYLANAPRYAIERVLSADMQAIYNILFMPIFLVSVLGQFVFVPMIARMSVWWDKGETERLLRSILRQVLIILGISIVIAIGGYLLGYWLLGLVYGVDLKAWRGLLVVLLLIGGISALCAFFTVILTIFRKQKVILIAYALAALIGWRMLDPLVARYNLYGAGLSYGTLMGIVLLIQTATIVFSFRDRRKEQSRKQIP